jgi:chromosome segregation protein
LRHRSQGVEREIARHAAAADQLANLAPAEQMAGQLGDYLNPAAELAPVLDRVWREWLELPVIRSRTLSSEQIETLAGLEGRIRLVAASKAPPPPDLSMPDGAEDLLLQAGVESEHLGWLARALPRTLRCDDLDRACELADELPDAVIVCGDGVIRRGRILEPTTRGDRHPGALQLRTMEHELKAEIADVSARADELTGRHQKAAGLLESQSDELASLDGEVVAAEQDRARTTTVEESLIQELGRIERELDSLATEEERSRTQAEDIDQRRTRLEDEVAKLEARSVELEQAVEDAANRLAGRREETADALRELDRRRSEARLAEERTEAARAEGTRLEEEAGALEHRVNALETEAGRLKDQQASTEEEVVRSRTRLVEEQGLLTAAREHDRRLAENVDAIMARVASLEKEVRVRRETHDRERETLHNIEVEQTRSDADWERVREHAADELGLAIVTLLEAETEPDDEPEALRTDIEALRAKIDRLGPVNLLALKELEELEERSQFLTHQRKDLVEALKSLDETIREIDATCIERFVATFEQVNEVFAETFSTLFGGGTARLDLVDEDDPLESGIDITAQPPGKRNQSVQLLSGGEKALTALSLLISLFRIKPSPFCILDEVDAPLDDANVERFVDLVQAMTDHTQFVLVTHNRRTMARADLLYGVTMEEPGVSKIVSVRVEDPQKIREGGTLLP